MKTPTAAATTNASQQQSPESTTPAAPKYVRLKYEMCKNFKEKGVCKYGDRCLFAHGDHELVKRGQVPSQNTASPAAEPAKKTDEPVAAADQSTQLTEQKVDDSKDMTSKEISLSLSEMPIKGDTHESSAEPSLQATEMDDLDMED